MWHINSDHLFQVSMTEEGQGNCNYSHNSQVQVLLKANSSSSAPSWWSSCKHQLTQLRLRYSSEASWSCHSLLHTCKPFCVNRYVMDTKVGAVSSHPTLHSLHFSKWWMKTPFVHQRWIQKVFTTFGLSGWSFTSWKKFANIVIRHLLWPTGDLGFEWVSQHCISWHTEKHLVKFTVWIPIAWRHLKLQLPWWVTIKWGGKRSCFFVGATLLILPFQEGRLDSSWLICTESVPFIDASHRQASSLSHCILKIIFISNKKQ